MNAPDALEPEITRLRDASTGKIERQELRTLLFPGLDLYQAGRLLLDLLDGYAMGDVISQLDAELVRLVADDLGEWKTAAHTTAATVLTDIRKLADGYWSGASTPQAPQLSPGKPVRQIALPKGSFLAPKVVERILETRSFRRLQRLKQLSLLDYVYPGANETRFSHSLAVYSTTVDLVTHLVRSPRFTKLFDTTQVDQLLITALLHDINHFPFLHYFQELDLAKEEGNNFFELFLGDAASGDDPSISTLLKDAGLSAERIVEVLTTKYDELQDPHLQVIKSIVDSSVDVDKLAYVPGDARSTGVPFGLGVDRAALLTGADILRVKSEGRPWHLCFHPRALSAVESLLLARYWNFKQIYWHHTNRAIGAMISHVLRQLASTGALSLREYAIETLGRSEFGAISYLDALYQTKFHRPSILRGLESRRAGLFKRFLSIRKPLSGTTAEDRRRERIIEELLRMSDRERTKVAERFSSRLGEILPLQRGEAPIVLLDVPGRPLDADLHQVYVANISLDGTPDEIIKSPFIDTLSKEFLNLSRTIRLFVPAEDRDAIGKAKLAASAGELEKLLEKCLLDPDKGAATTSTVR